MPPLKKSKWERFAQAVFSGKSQEQAAIEAGYAPSGARSRGSHLADRPEVAARIAELQEASASKKVMNRQERMERLSEIARARITDFVKCEKGISQIAVGLESAGSAAIQEVVSEEVPLGRGQDAPIALVTKLKLRDPIGAIAELNKMEGAYPAAKVDLTSKGNEIKPAPIFQIVDEETRSLLSRIQNGERTKPVEADPNIPGERGGVPSGQAPNPE